MKRYGGLFDFLCSMENLELAHRNARKGKSHYVEVKMVDLCPTIYLQQIRWLLQSQRFKTARYVSIRRADSGKERTIHKLPYFPDRIVHHAIVQALSGIWNRTLIRDTYACVPGRGIHDGVARVRAALADMEGTVYCLKMDARKFYQSIDPAVLKTMLRKKIKDKNVLVLLDEVVDSFGPGVPIGNYLSQFFGNLYLSGYDHWMKEERKCRYYFRYCDDVVVLDGDKERLHRLRLATDKYWCERLALDVKRNWQVFPVDARGVDFLGYRFFHGYTLLRKSIAKKMQRNAVAITHGKKQGWRSIVCSVMSYDGWLRHANCHNLRRAVMCVDLVAAVMSAADRAGMSHPRCLHAR